MQRVAAYYGDEQGKVKKQIQNGKRAAAKAAPAAEEQSGAEASPSEAMVKHVQRVVSAIEGRRVSREEVVAMLLRQRSMGKSASGGYDAARPDEHPP
jgi:protein-disulfide isomerase-like protein with CxxC motif